MTNTTTQTFTTEGYLSSDAKGKAALRSLIADAITSAIMASDIDAAQALVAIQQTFVTPKATVEVDWTSRIVDLYESLVAAASAISSGQVTMPEGVTMPDLSDVDWTATGGTVDTALVTKLATVAGRKAGRGAVADYVDSVLGDEAMTVAQLRAAWVASSDYPKAAPSAGAIGAMLDRDGAAEFNIEATEVDGKKAAVRA